MLRIGIVGVGQWGQRVGDKIAAAKVDGLDVKIVAHCRKGKEKIARFGRLVGLSDLVFADDVDVVVATAPPVTTLLAASGAMKIGKPILVTKPFLFTENVELKSTLVVDFVRLWSPCWKMLKYGIADKIAAGHRVVNVDVRFGGQGQGVGPVRSFSSIFDYGPHVFAFLYDLFGVDAVFSLTSVKVDDVAGGRQVFTIGAKMGGAEISMVTGNGVDGGAKYVRVTMSDESFLGYMDNGKVCSVIGPGTIRTRQVHVEWNHDPLSLMIANFLLDCRLGVIDPRTYVYSRLGIAACNAIVEAGVAG